MSGCQSCFNSCLGSSHSEREDTAFPGESVQAGTWKKDLVGEPDPAAGPRHFVHVPWPCARAIRAERPRGSPTVNRLHQQVGQVGASHMDTVPEPGSTVAS